MRHLKAGRKLGRTSAHRKALFRNMVTALIQQEKIRTTLAKAKELRSKVEKTITLGKKGTLHARRQAFKLVAEKGMIQKLFGPLAKRYAERNGGYTRIIKIGNRRGDCAPMAFIELVDREGEEPKTEPAETRGKAKKEAKSQKKTTSAKKTESKKAPAEKTKTKAKAKAKTQSKPKIQAKNKKTTEKKSGDKKTKKDKK
ncbi:MAG: 50S ribosomal protein L17 [Nitrospinota bacterium]|nr:50S ribosomal protein L17 [Nitrospinota bacterium]